jgi:hypothetical protein
VASSAQVCGSIASLQGKSLRIGGLMPCCAGERIGRDQFLCASRGGGRDAPRGGGRFIDDGELPAYRFGRVIRLKANEVDKFIEACRIEPGTLDSAPPRPDGRVDELAD